MANLNVFIVGLDDFHRAELVDIARRRGAALHSLFEREEVKARKDYPVKAMIAEGVRRLERFDGSVDAIVGYWDFPVTSLVSALARTFGTPAPSLEASLLCEHKYWSRCAQRRAVPEVTPEFCVVDPFGGAPLASVPLDYPFWVKPVKGWRSMLARKVGNAHEFEEHLAHVRDKLSPIAEGFDAVLDLLGRPPPGMAAITARHCICESVIGGHQFTVCGYVHDGQARPYGVVDSIRDESGVAFSHYEYPSSLPRAVRERAGAVACKLMEHIGYDAGLFNVEFFWDEARDVLKLLEVNPRLSESHTYLYEKVDGRSDLDLAVALALGQTPDLPQRAGRFARAGKFFLRHHQDAEVVRAPGEDAIAAVRREVPGTRVKLHVKPGARLSELPDQDEYSFELGDVFIGGDSRAALKSAFDRCAGLLVFEFRDVPGSELPRV
jgi:biotin carboxylase